MPLVGARRAVHLQEGREQGRVGHHPVGRDGDGPRWRALTWAPLVLVPVVPRSLARSHLTVAAHCLAACRNHRPGLLIGFAGLGLIAYRSTKKGPAV
jgi:hypothetical protein